MASLRKLMKSVKRHFRAWLGGAHGGLHDPVQQLIEHKTTYWQQPEFALRHLNYSGTRPQGISVPILALVLDSIPSPATILDVGCGHGRYSIPFAESGHRVVATDVSQEMLKLLLQSKGDLAIEARTGDAHRLNAADGEFDVVFSNDFMGHFPDWPTLLVEQARVCRPGGRVIFSIATREHREAAERLPTDRPFRPEYSTTVDDDRPFWAEASQESLHGAAAAAGLRIMAQHPLKFFSDSHIFGRLFGGDEYARLKQELNDRLAAEPAVGEFYSWLERRFLQRLPADASALTLVICEKHPRT